MRAWRILATALPACAGLPISAIAHAPDPQAAPSTSPASEGPGPSAATPGPESGSAPAGPTSLPSGTVRLSFKDAPIDVVLDYLAREAGVPIIFEAPAPSGTLTFVGARAYTLDEAISIVNLNLHRLGAHLRREGEFLHLASIQESSKKPTPVHALPGTGAAIPASVTPDQFITLTVPLNHARAEQVAEQVKPLIGPNGGVFAVPAQNMVVIVEAAGQVRRIQEIIGAIDAVRPVDSAHRLFPLRHADAEVALTALKGLVGERVVTTFVDKDGKKTTVQDINVAGLNLQADPRTNSIIAVGSQSRLKIVEELIALIDVPGETAGTGSMRTAQLASVSTDAAVARLTALFANGDPKKKPAIVGIPELSKVTIAGDKDQVDRGARLLEELDPNLAWSGERGGGSNADGRPAPAPVEAAVVALKNSRAGSIEPGLARLLSPRQQQVLKYAPAPDGRALVVTGPAPEVEAFRALVARLDVPDSPANDVRVLRVGPGAEGILARARAVYERLIEGLPAAEAGRVEALADADGRSITLTGSGPAVNRFAQAVQQVQRAQAPSELRHYPLKAARADRVLPMAQRLIGARLRELFPDGVGERTYEVAMDATTNAILVTAPVELHGPAREVIQSLDGQGEPARTEVRVVRLERGQAASVAGAVGAAMRAKAKPGEVEATITPEPASNSLVLAGTPEQVEAAAALVQSMDKGGERDGLGARTIPLTHARAEALAPVLEGVLKRESSVRLLPEWARAGVMSRVMSEPPEVKVAAEARLNAIIVSGPKAIIEVAEQVVKDLDVPSGAGRPAADARPVRILTLRNAEAEQVAQSLQGVFAEEAGAERPPLVRVDKESNSLVVRATSEQFAAVEQLAMKLDAATSVASRQIKTVPLTRGKADAAMMAETLRRLVDRSGGLRVEVISTKELIERSTGPSPSKPADVPGEAPGEVAPKKSSDASSPGGSPAWPMRALAMAAVASVPTGTIDARESAQPVAVVDEPGDAAVTIAVDPASNSLVLVGPPRQTDRLAALIAELERQLPVEPVGVHIIELAPGMDARGLAEVARGAASMMGRAGPTNPGGLTGPVNVFADPGQTAVVVLANNADFEVVGKLIGAMSKVGAGTGATPTVVRLKHVAAGRLRQTLSSAFSPIANQGNEAFAIEADGVSNALVIACSPRLLKLMTPVIEELDRAPDREAMPGQAVTIVELKHNAPWDVWSQLEQLGVMREQDAERPGLVSSPVSVAVLSSKRALAITATPADAKVVQGLIEKLDAEPVEGEQQVAIIGLRQAPAAQMATTLRQLLNPYNQASQTSLAWSIAEHLRRLSLLPNGVDDPKAEVDLGKSIRIFPDPASNSVIVASTPGNVAALREVIKTLDALPMGDAVVVRIFALNNSSASRVQQVVEQLFRQGEELRRLPGTQRQGFPTTATGRALAGSIAASVDERTNSLIVAGREEAVALVEVLIKDLDGERTSKWVEPAIIPLQHADAGELATKLREVLNQGLATTPEAAGLQRQFGRLRLRREGGDPGTAQGRLDADLFAPITGLAITPETSANALIVVGTSANIEVLRELVKMLDVPEASAANSVRVYPLEHAAADRVAAIIREVVRQRGGRQRPEDAVAISTDSRTNALVVSTSSKNFAIIEALLRTLDKKESDVAVGLHVIPVEGTDIQQLARKIERLMRDRLAAQNAGGARSSQDAFTIEAEPASGSLIVSCSDENLVLVKELVAALTAGSTRAAGASKVEIVPLAQARAAEVAPSIDALYVRKELERRGPGSLSVIANDRLNALVVSGTEADVEAVRALAARFDGAGVDAVRQVRPIELRSANAVEVVRLLQDVLAGTPVGGGRGAGARQATKLQFLRKRVAEELSGEGVPGPSEAQIDGAIRDQVVLTPDVRTNTVWITAPAPIVGLVAEMIEEQERTSAGSRRIEYFQLVNADARQMATVLRDTFNLRQQGNSLVLVPQGQARDAQSANDQSASDQPDGGVPPPGAPGSGPGSIRGPMLSAVPDERQQLSVAIDSRTNTLIVSGTDEYLGLVRTLVTQLDSIEANEREQSVYHLQNAKAKEIEQTLQAYFRGESVLARTTLGPQMQGALSRQLEQEVTVVGDEKSNKLVVSTSPRYMDAVMAIIQELDAPPPQVMIEVLLAEVTLDSERSWGMDARIGPLGGEALGASVSATGAGVASAIGLPNLAVSTVDFGLLVRALEAQGRLEVLSNPQVMANNNEEAKIQVGENVPIVTGVDRFAQGNSTAQVTRQDLGIILNVTPSISADGYVQMKINPEISSLSNRNVAVTADFSAPIINKRTLDTRVTVRDGQSVVIGGLIQTQQEKRTSKVPLLGDIPILGAPFRTLKDTNVKTELLVILTPRVMPGHSAEGSTQADRVSSDLYRRLDDSGRVTYYVDQIQQVERSRRSEGATDSATEPAPQPPGDAGDAIPESFRDDLPGLERADARRDDDADHPERSDERP